jgi:hypothetical protein
VSSRNQNIFLFVLLLLTGALYYLDSIAQVNFYYWTFWWYDIMMHFLGGFVVSGFGLWVFVRVAPRPQVSLWHTILLSIGIGMSIGIGWELFEYFNGMYADQPGIVADTAGDLIMDFIGSAVSGLVVYFGLLRQAQSQTHSIE